MKRIALLAAVMATAPAFGADLLGVYREAQLQDAVYAGAKAQYIAAQERLPQGRALLLPNVNFQAGTNYNDVTTDYPSGIFASGQRDFYDYNYGITVTQPIYRRQNSLVYEQSKIQVKQAENQLSAASQDLMTRVAQAYFDVLLARANLNTIRSQKTAVAEQLEQAKRNFIVGTATITDSREAQARYDLVVAQELGAENDLEVRMRALEQIIGKPAGELSGLSLPVTLNPPDPVDMNTWVNGPTEQPASGAGPQSLELAARGVDSPCRALPTLDAVGSLTKNRQFLAPGHRAMQALVIGCS
jgi:outer membrane protein